MVKSIVCKIFVLILFCCQCYATGSTKEENSKTIIVTCATGELGGAIARRLAPEFNLILTGRDRAKLQSLKEELSTNHSKHYQIFSLDYTVHASLQDFEQNLNASQESIVGFVLITPRPSFSQNLLKDESEWLQLFQTNFTGPLEALKSVQGYLEANGKIVIIGGTTSVQLIPEYGPACIIRRMWTTYAKALSHQLGPRGIHVNVLSPGVVLTDFHHERINKKAVENAVSYEEQMVKDAASIPLRRHAMPQEIANTVKFLLSKESDFITGANLIIDGGFTVTY